MPPLATCQDADESCGETCRVHELSSSYLLQTGATARQHYVKDLLEALQKHFTLNTWVEHCESMHYEGDPRGHQASRQHSGAAGPDIGNLCCPLLLVGLAGLLHRAPKADQPACVNVRASLCYCLDALLLQVRMPL